MPKSLKLTFTIFISLFLLFFLLTNISNAGICTPASNCIKATKCPNDTTNTGETCNTDEICCKPKTPEPGETKDVSQGGAVSLTNPISFNSFQEVIGNIIKTVLLFIGAIALLMFVYGGILMLTSGGNPTQVTKGKSVLIWAVIGLAVIIFSYTLASFVITAMTGGT